MNVYILTPNTVLPNPHLFPPLLKTWVGRGWYFVNHIEDAEVVLLDLHSRISGYDQRDIDWVIQNRTPIAVFDEYDRGGMSKDEFPFPLTEQHNQIFASIHKHNAVFFCRLMYKTKSYAPYQIFPYEKPIIYEEPPYSADYLFNRKYDIVWIANTAPQRERLAQALRGDGRLKCNIVLGAEKIPFQKWIDEHRRGKLFVSCSGGGFTDERCQHLFSIAGIIRERTEQLLLNDFTHLDNCLRIDSTPTTKDIDTIVEIVNDKERLYDIYKSGYEFMKTCYSPEYIATNIAEIIEKHLE